MKNCAWGILELVTFIFNNFPLFLHVWPFIKKKNQVNRMSGVACGVFWKWGSEAKNGVNSLRSAKIDLWNQAYELVDRLRVLGWSSYATRMEYYRVGQVVRLTTSSDNFFSCFGRFLMLGDSKSSTGRSKERILELELQHYFGNSTT